MKKTILMAFVAALFMVACTSAKDKNAGLETSATADTTAVAQTSTPAEDVVTMTVASKRADCTGVAKMQCLLIKEGDAAEWSFFYSGIEGFNYEEGFEYVIEVKKENLENVPADASSIKYTLVKEVSKTKKESENMPVMPK